MGRAALALPGGRAGFPVPGPCPEGGRPRGSRVKPGALSISGGVSGLAGPVRGVGLGRGPESGAVHEPGRCCTSGGGRDGGPGAPVRCRGCRRGRAEARTAVWCRPGRLGAGACVRSRRAARSGVRRSLPTRCPAARRWAARASRVSGRPSVRSPSRAARAGGSRSSRLTTGRMRRRPGRSGTAIRLGRPRPGPGRTERRSRG